MVQEKNLVLDRKNVIMVQNESICCNNHAVISADYQSLSKMRNQKGDKSMSFIAQAEDQ